MQTELLVVTILKALTELAGLFLLGQGLLYVLAGAKRDGNAIYQLFRVLTGPVIRLVRLITPRAVLDRHLPIVAFLLLVWVWLGLLYWKAAICTSGSIECVPDSARSAAVRVVDPVWLVPGLAV